MSGLAIGSMIAGIGSILISLVVLCFGIAGADRGWGPLVAGAFAILAGLIATAGVGAGMAALRQIRAAPGQLAGRGMAHTGVICGAVGFGLTLLAFLAAVLLG